MRQSFENYSEHRRKIMMRTCHTDAMEVLLELMPLHLVVERALKEWLVMFEGKR